MSPAPFHTIITSKHLVLPKDLAPAALAPVPALAAAAVPADSVVDGPAGWVGYNLHTLLDRWARLLMDWGDIVS